MSLNPTWLTDREEIALAALQGGWDEDAVHIAANSPAQVLALLKLVRKLGTAIDRYMETGHASVLMRADEAYQLGPILDEDKS